MLKQRKVIIDCDPGIDDSLALMLALSSEELDVIGITIVCGNAPVELGINNAKKVLTLMNRFDIPIYKGEEKPLVRDYQDALDTHGEDGLGGSKLDLIKSDQTSNIKILDGASEFIVQSLKAVPDLTIVAIGPLTNIAKALEKEETAFQNLDMFIAMGGSYKSHGNCSPVAEYNFWCDPHAAKIVFETFERINKKVHMVGLDVTREIVLTPDILSFMRRIESKKSAFIEKIVQFYFDFHWQQEGIIGCVINDPLAIAYLLDPSICEGFESYTTVETEGVCIGQSVVDSMEFWKKTHNSVILTKTHPKAFFQMFIKRVLGADEDLIMEILSACKVEE